MALAKIIRNFAYKCPECGETVSCEADIFSLSDGYIRHCECGGSSLRVSKHGGRYRVDAPCGFCGESHTAGYTMMEFVRGNPLFIFCPMNDRYCACIGVKEKISREIGELEASYNEREKIRRAPDEYWNTVTARRGILTKMVAMIDGGLMSCVCGGKNMRLKTENGETLLVCLDCGNETEIPTLAGVTLEEFPEIEPIFYRPEVSGGRVIPINPGEQG